MCQGLSDSWSLKHEDYVQEEQSTNSPWGPFQEGHLIVVQHVVHSPLLGQSTHLVEQLIGSAVVQDGNGAHLLPAAKHLCSPAHGLEHISGAEQAVGLPGS